MAYSINKNIPRIHQAYPTGMLCTCINPEYRDRSRRIRSLVVSQFGDKVFLICSNGMFFRVNEQVAEEYEINPVMIINYYSNLKLESVSEIKMNFRQRFFDIAWNIKL